MIKIKQILMGIILLSAVASCTNAKKEGDSTAVTDLKNYVDSINSANLEYSKDNWVAIDNGYKERALRAEAELDKLSDEEKAELEASKSNYATLSVKYQTELGKITIDPKIRLRNSLFGEGKVGDDMAFLFANSDNLLSIYQSFVDAVDVNRETYSREDWDEIKLLYEALDTRKNAVENTLDGEDNRKIAALKIKFASIYTRNRPLSKARENSEAKE